MRYSITSNLTFYQRIGKNMFSIGKTGILKPLEILRLPKNFWPLERPWIFIWTIWCFTQADMTFEVIAVQVQVYIQQWFHDEQKAMFNVLSVVRNDFGHNLICWWVSLFVKVSYWGQVVEMNFSSFNFNSCWELFLSLPAES